MYCTPMIISFFHNLREVSLSRMLNTIQKLVQLKWPKPIKIYTYVMALTPNFTCIR